MIIDNEFKSLIPVLTDEEFNQLEANILKEGIRDSLIVWGDILVDGHNRYAIADKHKIEFTTKEINFDTREDAKRWIILNQFGRRNINNYQRSVLALKLEDIYKAKAKENLVSSGKEFGKGMQKSANPIDKIDTREELSKTAKVSHDTISKVKKIEELATDDVKKELASGHKSINQIFNDIRRDEIAKKQKEKNEVLKFKEIAPLTGKFDVIVIDPPWQMEKIKRDVAPLQVGFDYPTMTIDEIKKYQLPAEKDCHVFMWITHKHLPSGFDIFKEWGVKYVCCFVWHKNGGFQPFGLPQYNCEFVLYGRIGIPTFIDLKDFNVCFNANRTKHSEKPEEFYDTLRRVTAGRRADIFNRRDIEGFDKWGNEA